MTPFVVFLLLVGRLSSQLVMQPSSPDFSPVDTHTSQQSADNAWVDGVVRDVQSLYTTRDTSEQDRIFAARYAENATFEDPIMKVAKPSYLRVQFHALVRLFSNISFETTNVSRSFPSNDGKMISIVVNNTQTYFTSNSTFMPPSVVVYAQTTLCVHPQSLRILKHHDTWLNNDILPAFMRSQFYQNNMKSIVGTVVSNLLKLLKW